MTYKTKEIRLNNSLKRKTIFIWCAGIFVLKLLIIAQIEGYIWPGADAENYLSGLSALHKEGFFSSEGHLLTWPAGYPIFLLIFSFFKETIAGLSISIVQSLIFSFSIFVFILELSRSKARRFSFPTLILLLINPTLSLSTLTIGYESLVASIFLIVLSIMMADLRTKDTKSSNKRYFMSAILLGFTGFLEARFLLPAIILMGMWGFLKLREKNNLKVAISALILMGLLPAILIARNVVAGNGYVISNNLGYTLSIGNGEGATGGYGVPHPPCMNQSTDSKKTSCVIRWDLMHPISDFHLIINKSQYFWSPWSGPLANGTMGRNPWLKIDPIYRMEKDPNGNKLVFSLAAKIISYLWLFGSLIMAGFGYLALRRVEPLIANVVAIIVMTNWVISAGTIGDHRFRLPILGLTLFLQAVGISATFRPEKVTRKSALKGKK